MLAWERARQWQQENCMTPFEDVLGSHLSWGLVYSTPSVFLLASQVIWDPVKKEIIADQPLSSLQQPNAWFVELAASSTNCSLRSPICEFLRVASQPLEFCLWRRASKNRVHDIHSYRWDKLASRVGL